MSDRPARSSAVRSPRGRAGRGAAGPAARASGRPPGTRSRPAPSGLLHRLGRYDRAALRGRGAAVDAGARRAAEPAVALRQPLQAVVPHGRRARAVRRPHRAPGRVTGVAAIGAASLVVNQPMKLAGNRDRPDRDGPRGAGGPLGADADVDVVPVRPLGVGRWRSRSRSVTWCRPCACRCGRPRRTVAFSRVYTGVHYPGDVLVGAATGALLGRLVSRAVSPGRTCRGADRVRDDGAHDGADAGGATGDAARAPRRRPRGPAAARVAPRDRARLRARTRATRAMTDDEVEAWADYLAARRPWGAVSWAVETDGELVGARVPAATCGRRGRKARLAIGLYAPQFLGRGLGTEAIRLVLRHAFGTLGHAPGRPEGARLQRPGHRRLPRVRLRRGGARAGELLGRGAVARRRRSWACSTASSPRSTRGRAVADLDDGRPGCRSAGVA